jgi:hypothetical protein
MEAPLAVLSQVACILEKQGIEYVVVGSFASSLHGVYRATADIDLVAALKQEHVKPFAEALQDDFYLDAITIRQAILLNKSFNLIHFDSAFKIDLFVLKPEPFNQQELARRQPESIGPDLKQQIYVATAEDTILAKLKWYRKGGEVSRKQWSDITGVLKVRRQELDYEYLRHWAAQIGVSDLLKRILAEVSTI